MRIPRDLTIAGFATQQLNLAKKQVEMLKRELELYQGDRFVRSPKTFKKLGVPSGKGYRKFQ